MRELSFAAWEITSDVKKRPNTGVNTYLPSLLHQGYLHEI